MRSVTLTKQECAVKQAILKNKRRKLMTEVNLVEKVKDNNAGARSMFNHLGVREAATREIILASKRQKTASSDNLEEDVIVEEEVSNKDGGRVGQLVVDLASDDDVEIVEKEKEACGSGHNNATKDSMEREEEDPSAFWRRIGLQMVPISIEKSCEVRLKRISTEKGKTREAVGLRSSERIQQLKMAAMKSSPPPIPTVLYNKRKVVVELVAEELSSFSSPCPSAPLIVEPFPSNSTSPTSPSLPAAAPNHSCPTFITASLVQSPLSSPCSRKEEPTPSSSKPPVKKGNLGRLRRNLEIKDCEEKGQKKKKKGSLEKLRRKLDVCAQEIRECEEKEMDWAEGAGSGYMKAGKLKKKLARLCNQLEARQGSVSVADKVSGHDWMSLYLEENDQDPAESNPELEAKLNNQLKEGRSKINK